MRTLLDIDLAELADEPPELYACADIANLACGGHAGDDHTVAEAVARCRAAGAAVGAHPSYPDREHFGRRRVVLPADALAATIAEQCARVASAAARLGLPVEHLKPHGALYHEADGDDGLAAAVLEAAARALPRLRWVLGPAGGALARAAAARGLILLREGFADRRAEEIAPGRWRLLPRDVQGALISDPAAAVDQARRVAPTVDVIGVHGDNPAAVAVARAVRAYLEAGTPTPTGQLTPVPPMPQ